MLYSDRPTEILEEMLHFTKDIATASAVSFAWINKDLSSDVVSTIGLRDDFMDDYYRAACQCDPLTASRITARNLNITRLSNTEDDFDPRAMRTYRRFLDTHGLADELQILLRVDDKPLAMVGLFQVSDSFFGALPCQWSALHRSLEFFLAFHPRASSLRKLTRMRNGFGLTEREAEVAALISEGYSNKMIADTLTITIPTVKCHVIKSLDKLGVQSRTGIAAKILSL